MLSFLIGVMVCDNFLQLVFYRRCPWTLEEQSLNLFLESVLSLLEVFKKSYLHLCYLLVASGFQLVTEELSDLSIRLFLTMTIVDIFLNWISNHFAVTSVLVIFFCIAKLIFTFVTFGLVLFYYFMSIKKLRTMTKILSRNAFVNPVFTRTRNFLKFRMNLVVWSFLLI